MKRMLMLANREHCIFFPLDAKEEALTFRATNPEFRRRHVRDIIQAYEDRVKYGVTYERGCEWPKCVREQWLTCDDVTPYKPTEVET